MFALYRRFQSACKSIVLIFNAACRPALSIHACAVSDSCAIGRRHSDLNPRRRSDYLLLSVEILPKLANTQNVSAASAANVSLMHCIKYTHVERDWCTTATSSNATRRLDTCQQLCSRNDVMTCNAHTSAHR